MTDFIEISLIVVEHRVRKEFSEVENINLSESIRKLGLLHAIVLESHENQFFLRAGERRLRAVTDIYDLGSTFTYNQKQVPEGFIPYTLFENLSELERLEIEYEENSVRVDFTWQEQAMMTEKLMKLRTLQACEQGQTLPTPTEISKELRGKAYGSYLEATRQELIVAKHLNNPLIKNAKTTKEAFKTLKRQEKAEKFRESAEAFQQTSRKQSNFTLVQADALVWMRSISSAEFNIILTDPPYGVEAHSFTNVEKVQGNVPILHEYEDSYENALAAYECLAEEGFRITKPDAHLYAFCDIDMFLIIKKVFSMCGWRVFRTPLIWSKPQAFRAPWPEHGPRRTYECIFFAIKGDRKVNMLAPDVLTFPLDENLDHGAQKPVALFSELLRRSSRPGDHILDPFCGTGTVFPAAYANKCLATGIELNPTFCGMALSRVAAIEEVS